MAIDKALYQAPVGMPAEAQGQPDLQIEIENPEAVHIGMDGMEINFEKQNYDDYVNYISNRIIIEPNWVPVIDEFSDYNIVINNLMNNLLNNLSK